MKTTRVIVHGASGRMGQEVIAACDSNPDIEISAAISIETALTDLIPNDKQADVVIDFSLPDGFDAAVDWCAQNRVALVSGTTGLSQAQLQRLGKAADLIAVLWSPNMSLGASLLGDLAGRAVSALGNDVEVEIIEAHHRDKKDAPSGTALKLGNIIAAARGQDLDVVGRFTRHGQTGQRDRNEIGFSVIRSGDIVGEHTVLLSLDGERLELTHKATDRKCFARGAVTAAQWLSKQAPGRYDIKDILQ